MKACECGVEIEFAKGPNGNAIPLEPIRHIYQIVGQNAIPVSGTYRNHYTTCPKAAEFRKPRGAVGPPAENSKLVHDLLLAVLEEPPSLETIQGWTPQQRFEAMEWAAREQVAKKDQDGSQRLPRPDQLEDTR